ncbi:MAG: hypothetical protein U0516_04800 [Candidatus Saccharibacteria bacterium]
MKSKKLYFGLGTAFVIFGTWMIKKKKSQTTPKKNTTKHFGWSSWNVGDDDPWL